MLFRRKNGSTAGPPPIVRAQGGSATGPGPESDAGRSVSDRRMPGGGRTVIGSQTRIKGVLRGDGSVVVRGAVEGSIAIGGDLTVAPGGRVQADIEALSVALEGEARGSIRAGARVTLSESGLFEGQMATPVLDLSPGSVLRGSARIAGVPIRDRRGLSH